MANKRLNLIQRLCQKEHSQYHKLDDMIITMCDMIVYQYEIYKHCFIYSTYYSYSYHGINNEWKDVGACFCPKRIYNNNRPTIIIFIRAIRDSILEIKNKCHQHNVLDWHKEVYKELSKVILHEFRHYQQYKYFKDNGLDFLDYTDLLKMNDVPYDEEMTETDAVLYSEDPENGSLSLKFLVMDYCMNKIQFLGKLIKETPECEDYKEQIQELYELGRKFIDHEVINKFSQSNNMEVK